MKTSEKIRQRLKEKGIRFHSNDNIADFLEGDDIEKLQKEVEESFSGVLDALVIDTENDHNTKETARRVAKMYMKEIFAGRFVSPPKVTSFPNMGYRSLYTSGPISVKSTCAHHFQNIVGKCWVGILPEKEVIGLSKFNRIVHHIAERPQIQEEMTTQVAEALQKYAKTPNVAVLIKAEHHCMTQKGKSPISLIFLDFAKFLISFHCSSRCHCINFLISISSLFFLIHDFKNLLFFILNS